MTHNISSSEIEKFNDFATDWWDENGRMKSLHDINPLRLEYIMRQTDLTGKRVLDVGCGGGLLSEPMARLGAEVVGADAAERNIPVARVHAQDQGLEIDYRHTTAEELATGEAGQYDVVTCLEMLEHVPDPAEVVRSCTDLLRPGGHVFFSTINRNPKSFVFAIVGAEYILRLLPRGTHEYEKFIRPSELEEWARTAGLELRASVGLHYNPLMREYWLGPGLDVNYLMYYQRPASD